MSMGALWDLSCPVCHVIENDVACSIFAIPACPTCGGPRFLGDRAIHHPFIPYFDFALGAEVTSHAHRWRLMKEAHVDYRDKMRPGDLSARLDRVEAQRKREREQHS